VRPVSPVVPGMELCEVVLAKDQPEYIPLPVAPKDDGHRIVTRWKLSVAERLRILFTGNLWLSVLTFGKPFPPVLLETESPSRYILMHCGPHSILRLRPDSKGAITT
jgi:hypothetical protein